MRVYDDLREYIPNTKPRKRKEWDAEYWRDRIKERTRAEAAGVAGLPIIGPVRVDIDFYFSRPGYMLSSKYSAGRIQHDIKPDRDNLDKLVLDAINQAGWTTELSRGEYVTVKTPLVWEDDCRACQGEPQKWYVAHGGAPGAQIRITRLRDPEPSLLEHCELSKV